MGAEAPSDRGSGGRAAGAWTSGGHRRRRRPAVHAWRAKAQVHPRRARSRGVRRQLRRRSSGLLHAPPPSYMRAREIAGAAPRDTPRQGRERGPHRREADIQGVPSCASVPACDDGDRAAWSAERVHTSMSRVIRVHRGTAVNGQARSLVHAMCESVLGIMHTREVVDLHSWHSTLPTRTATGQAGNPTGIKYIGWG